MKIWEDKQLQLKNNLPAGIQRLLLVIHQVLQKIIWRESTRTELINGLADFISGGMDAIENMLNRFFYGNEWG
jgi:hypothetical protein